MKSSQREDLLALLYQEPGPASLGDEQLLCVKGRSVNNVDGVAPGWGGTTPLITSLYGCQETSTRQDVPPTALQLRLGVSRKCVFVGLGQASQCSNHGGDN